MKLDDNSLYALDNFGEFDFLDDGELKNYFSAIKSLIPKFESLPKTELKELPSWAYIKVKQKRNMKLIKSESSLISKQ